ncbi:MAG: hypothetical protein H5U07_05335 [Candidatus Aminicenantes bacterium]|nr:hypothetical protein [Candidatus Aminicenantes bacterium]
MKKASPFFLALIIFFFLINLAEAQNQPSAKPPVLLTSCGQSPGPALIKVMLQKLGVDFELIPLATAADLQKKKETGQPFGSVIIVMGASLKGMGAAGISIDDEIKRVNALIQEARNQGLTIIGAHVEGMKRRAQGAAAGDTTDEQSIDAVAPKANILLINKEGNADGRFTQIARSHNIPLIEVEKNLDLITTLSQIFGLNK